MVLIVTLGCSLFLPSFWVNCSVLYSGYSSASVLYNSEIFPDIMLLALLQYLQPISQAILQQTSDTSNNNQLAVRDDGF